DHGALSGLLDDDHTQYRLESADHSHQTTGAQAGTLDHGAALTGLSDDDHTQYLLLLGRASGQTAIGGTASLETLALQGSSHADGGKITLNSDTITGLVEDAAAVMVNPTISTTSVNVAAFAVKPTFTGAATSPQGFLALPTFQPSASIATTLGFIGIAKAETPAGVTITSHIGYYGRSDYAGTTGAVTSGYTMYIATPDAPSTLKPGTQYGINIENQGLSGMTTAYGLRIAPQSGATTNIGALIEANVKHASGVTFAMLSQNRFRHLNSMASVYQAADQNTITVNVWTALTFGAELFDTDGLHDNVTNPTRLTLPLVGKWLVFGALYNDYTNITLPAQQGIRIHLNGGAGANQLFGYNLASAAGATTGGIATSAIIVTTAVTDYVELAAIITGTGGTWDADNIATGITNFGAAYIGE
ncbi:MAG: hypothetical protein Q7K13_00670, partial [Polynucleobacter sp.]|uniref:hypothetical protein n=1 Tax=Polynucleobacter sp. TaxID=2029855 RepID=UPI00271E8CE6